MVTSENTRRISCFSVTSDETSKTLTALGEIRQTPSVMARGNGPTALERMVEIQSEAEYVLRSAIMNERARRWEKVVNIYNSFLKLISRRNLPQGFTLTDSYVLLIYESYYHLGLALQNLNRHKEAVDAYTQAIKSVDIHKNGCLAGCNANSCFQTPVLAKRAFAFARMGNMKRAFIDIEKAVVLDTRNSDLYCIRALLWNTVKDTEKAVDDLNRALRYNPCHVCALLLRGSIDQPFRITFNFLDGLSLKNNQKAMKKDHVKAQQISPQADQFMDVIDIHSSKLIKLWNRFLWSLNVPRNIVHPDLMEGFNIGRNKVELRPTVFKRRKSTPVISVNGKLASDSPEAQLEYTDIDQVDRKPFRCGTPTMQRDPIFSKRTKSYGNAIRTYSTALQTSKLQAVPIIQSRPVTAMSNTSSTLKSATPSLSPPSQAKASLENTAKRQSVSFSQTLLTVPNRRFGTASAPPTLVHPTSRRSSVTTTKPRITSAQSAAQLSVARSLARATSAVSKRDVALSQRRSASEYAHRVHGIRVFNSTTNVTDAPRMYYKPWLGDKLPVADKKIVGPVGIFRV